MEEEIKRRQGYYFGIIPANTFGHVTIVVTLSIMMICCCTWGKFYKAEMANKQERKQKMKESQEAESKRKS